MTTIAAKSGPAVAADLTALDEMAIHRSGETVGQPIEVGELRAYLLTDLFAGTLSGAGTTQGAGTVLAANKNIATVVTGTDNAFVMPAGTSALTYVVLFNDDSADSLQLFPASGEDIGAGTDAAFTIAAGDWARFEKKDATTWYLAAGTVGV